MLLKKCLAVRNLGNFMLKLIQKNNNKFVMTNMCTCVILLPLRLVANMFINNILIIAKMILSLTNLRIEMYTTKRPMLKAPVAPVPLMVSCSKSRTTVGAGRCTQCSPSNVHREVDDPRKKKTSAVIRKNRAVAKTLQKN